MFHKTEQGILTLLFQGGGEHSLLSKNLFRFILHFFFADKPTEHYSMEFHEAVKILCVTNECYFRFGLTYLYRKNRNRSD